MFVKIVRMRVDFIGEEKYGGQIKMYGPCVYTFQFLFQPIYYHGSRLGIVKMNLYFYSTARGF